MHRTRRGAALTVAERAEPVVPAAQAPRGPQDGVALATVLANCARETGALAELTGAIDEAFGAMRLAGTGWSGREGRVLQRLDLLRQALEGLARFQAELAAQVDEGVIVQPEQAARDLALRDLAAALARDQPPEPGRQPVQVPGEVQLF